MTHVARQADAAGHTAKADCDLEQLSLLCNDLTGLHTAPAQRSRSAHSSASIADDDSDTPGLQFDPR